MQMVVILRSSVTFAAVQTDCIQIMHACTPKRSFSQECAGACARVSGTNLLYRVAFAQRDLWRSSPFFCTDLKIVSESCQVLDQASEPNSTCALHIIEKCL